MNNSKTRIAYIVMEGHDHEGLCACDSPFRVFLTKKAAEKSAKKKLKDSKAYFEIVEVIIPA